MRSPVQALAWEFWAGHRRNWLMIGATFLICAVLFQVLGEQTQKSDLLGSLCWIPFILSLGLMLVNFNFTEVNLRKGFAGYPQRLFTMPIGSWLLVGAPMVCGIVSVVLLYTAWVEFVFRPAGFRVPICWPATNLATAVVLFQAMVWCLSGFRITRLLLLGCTLPILMVVGFIPMLPPSLRGGLTEQRIGMGLAVVVLGSYCLAVLAIGQQRRGGGAGSGWLQGVVRQAIDLMPHREWNLSSPDRALLWMEWRRSGLVLPIAVLLLAVLILGPIGTLAGRGGGTTMQGVVWILFSPMLLAIPIGRGSAKPDFWTLELSLSPFLAARPISGGQIVAAKMKAAALSVVLAYGVMMVAATLWVMKGDTENLRNLCEMLRTVYSPSSQWLICGFGLGVMLIVTWSVLVGSLWLGYSGRPWFFSSGVVAAIVLFIASLVAAGVCVDLSESDGQFVLKLLRWVPWILAAGFVFKTWGAVWIMRRLDRNALVSRRSMIRYFSFWMASTACCVLLAWFIAPKVEWVRYTLYLAALLVVPLARIQAAPLAVAWNRHR